MFDPFKDFATAGYLRNRYKAHGYSVYAGSLLKTRMNIGSPLI